MSSSSEDMEDSRVIHTTAAIMALIAAVACKHSLSFSDITDLSGYVKHDNSRDESTP